jgi:hypothetical protein
VRLSFGIGVIFVPFGLVVSAEYVLAASYASHLAEVVTSFIAPLAFVPAHGEAAVDVDEIPTQAVIVPEEQDFDSISEPTQGTAKQPKAARAKPTKARELAPILVRAGTVLRLANSGRRPSGKSVTAEGRRPAGVQVFGASSLGVGVRDGDVITRVSGVPVTSASQIIALVIAARGARQSAISAQVFRGQRSYTLTVEQPYLTGEPPPASSEKPAGAN